MRVQIFSRTLFTPLRRLLIDAYPFFSLDSSTSIAPCNSLKQASCCCIICEQLTLPSLALSFSFSVMDLLLSGLFIWSPCRIWLSFLMPSVSLRWQFSLKSSYFDLLIAPLAGVVSLFSRMVDPPAFSVIRVKLRGKVCRLVTGCTGCSAYCNLLAYSNNCYQVIRILQSFCKQRVMNRLMLDETCGLGSKTRLVSSMALMREAMECDWKGQRPYSISNRMTPTDHTSAFTEQASPLSTSGAMYSGEPSIVRVMPWMPSSLQKPKSANLKCPSLISTFSGFKSLCMMLWRLSTLSPATSCANTPTALFSSSGPSLRSNQCRVPPSQYSQTKQQLLRVWSSSWKRTIWGQGSRTLWMASQLLMHSLTLLFQASTRLLMTLMAKTPPSSRWRPRNTWLQAPLPSCYPSSQRLTMRRTCSSPTRDLFSIVIFYNAGKDQKKGLGGEGQLGERFSFLREWVRGIWNSVESSSDSSWKCSQSSLVSQGRRSEGGQKNSSQSNRRECPSLRLFCISSSLIFSVRWERVIWRVVCVWSSCLQTLLISACLADIPSIWLRISAIC